MTLCSRVGGFADWPQADRGGEGDDTTGGGGGGGGGGGAGGGPKAGRAAESVRGLARVHAAGGVHPRGHHL
eukprot:400199-Pyramimonas_sp.AAC.2